VHVVHAQPVKDEPNLLGPAANSVSGQSVCPETVIDATNMPETSVSSVKNAIKKAFRAIKDAEDPIDTLILVYSGHHGHSGFHLLGNDQDVLSDETLCEQIQELHNVKKVIAFLDCCYAKRLADCGLGQLKVVQFRSSNRECKTFARRESSFFTKFVIQAFTRKANDARCWNARDPQTNECDNCEELDTDIITIQKLANYIEKHMKVFGENNLCPVSPSFDAAGINGPDWVIGFKMPCNAKLKFNVKKNGGLQDESVSMKDCKMDLKGLKRHFLRMLFESKYWNGKYNLKVCAVLSILQYLISIPDLGAQNIFMTFPCDVLASVIKCLFTLTCYFSLPKIYLH